MKTPESQAPDFERIARLYRWAEYAMLGSMLQRTRTALLQQVVPSQLALLLGDGDGRFSAALLRCHPAIRMLAVDSSKSMLTLLQRRCYFASDRLSVLQANLLALPESVDLGPFDLIVSHFVLDCFSQDDVDQLATAFAAKANGGTRWLVSDFAYPGRQPWRFFGTIYIDLLYRGFRLVTGLRVKKLPNLQKALSCAGFQRLHRVSRLRGLLFTELWVLASKQEIAQLAHPTHHPPVL